MGHRATTKSWPSHCILPFSKGRLVLKKTSEKQARVISYWFPIATPWVKMLDINWDTYLGIPCYASKFRRNHAHVCGRTNWRGLDQDGPWRPLDSNIVKSLVRLFHANYAMDQVRGNMSCLISTFHADWLLSFFNLEPAEPLFFSFPDRFCGLRFLCPHASWHRISHRTWQVRVVYTISLLPSCSPVTTGPSIPHNAVVGIIDYTPTRYNWSRSFTSFTNTAQHAFEIACDELFIVRWKLGRGMPQPRGLWTVCHLISKVPAAPFLASSGSSSCPESVWKTWSAKAFPRDRRSTQVTWVSMVPTWKVAWMLGLGKRSQSQATVNGRDNNQQYATHSN